MKVVVSWLREFCPIDADPDPIADALTAVGVKVEQIIYPWAELDGVVIARVLDVSDHPESEKLCVVRVDSGSGEHTVCAGVRNMKPGDLVPYAGPGSRVPVIPQPLGVKTLRGVESEGMLCSPKELGVSDGHGGILVLPPEDQQVGVDFKRYAGLDDAVLDIEIEPNRPDLMSVIGVAREAGAVFGMPMVVPPVACEESEPSVEGVAVVQIDDPEGCPAYLARVIRGVRVAPSPITIQARLTASGMRPISNVVDATNYVLLERGHPMHPFDLASVADATIVVRRATAGEEIETLDGVVRELWSEDLVIADPSRPLAIAGVMGSAVAEVSEETTDVLLETALFRPTSVLRTARRLQLSTEASMRFERGVDPEGIRLAGDRAAGLIASWAGGSVLAGAAGRAEPPQRRTVSVRPSRATAVLGEDAISADVIAQRLRTIEIPAAVAVGDEVQVEVPGWRGDIRREIDVIEEIARLDRGYERVVGTLPTLRGSGGMSASYGFRRRAKQLLCALGFHEMRAPSFASEADLASMGDPTDRAIRVANPLAADEGYLRTRLTPGLLHALQRNRARNVGSVRLFESGVVFRSGDPVEEVHKIGFALMGPAEGSWHSPARTLDIFDATGVLEAFFDGLGVRGWSLGEPAPMPFHPGRSAAVLLDGIHAGTVGEIHPRICQEFDLADRAAIGVLSADHVERAASSEVTAQDVPRFPPVRRDLAFVVPSGVRADQVVGAIRRAAGGPIGEVVLFDVFAGAPVPEGHVSLAYSIELRADDRTMTDEESDEVVVRIAQELADRFDAELRGA